MIAESATLNLQAWPAARQSLPPTNALFPAVHARPAYSPTRLPAVPCLLLYISILFVNVKLEAHPFSAITRFVVCKHFNILHGNPFARIRIFIQVTKKQLFSRKGFCLALARRCVTGTATPPSPPRGPPPPPSHSHFTMSVSVFRPLQVCLSRGVS